MKWSYLRYRCTPRCKQSKVKIQFRKTYFTDEPVKFHRAFPRGSVDGRSTHSATDESADYYFPYVSAVCDGLYPHVPFHEYCPGEREKDHGQPCHDGDENECLLVS